MTIVSAPLSDATQWFFGSGTVSVTGYPQDRAWWGESERIDAGGFNIKAANVLASPYTVQNLSFTATVGSKALTVALKGIDGNAPSATNPINIAFRSATATSSVTVLRTVTAATSVVLSSGSSLGFGSGASGYIYVYAIDYAGTVELALGCMPAAPYYVVVSTTAEGGSGGADSATTLYSTTARTNIPCRLIGIITITTGATAGEWDNAPTVIATVAGGSVTNLSITEAKLASSAVAQAKLKTSTGEVSVTKGGDLTLPGGEYGFYPQVKYSTGAWVAASIASTVESTSYVTNIYLGASGEGFVVYARQRYVTSSGEVNWLFFLRDKVTKAVKASYSAPDHPCMGNGGDPDIVQHPFPNYNSETEEIICINPTNEELDAIRAKIPKGGSLLQTISETYKIDDKVDKQWPTKTVTVGLPEGYDWMMAKSGVDVTPIKAVIPKPSNVLCKALVSKTAVIEEVKV